jgi:phenol 2-monooxygenase (NADPH)
LVPQIILRAADAKPIEIQDLCPADTKFRILLFLGDLSHTQQVQRVNKLATNMRAAEGFLNKFGRMHKQSDCKWDVFEILTICAGKKESISYLDVPPFFRPHWTK